MPRQRASDASVTPFHYSLELEYALLTLFGERSRWDNMAAAFQNPKFVREALLASVRRLRSRTRQLITSDDRLLLTTSIALDSLEAEAKRLTSASNNQLEIIAALLSLVVYLLGYDWLSGSPNRQVVFFQTLEQQILDDQHRHSATSPGSIMTEFQKRLEAVTRLHDEGFRPPQIARILLMSEQLIKQLLIRAGRLTRASNIKAGGAP